MNLNAKITFYAVNQNHYKIIFVVAYQNSYKLGFISIYSSLVFLRSGDVQILQHAKKRKIPYKLQFGMLRHLFHVLEMQKTRCCYDCDSFSFQRLDVFM